MPTFTAIALDRLLEPGGASGFAAKTSNDSKPVQNSKLSRRNSTSTVVTATEEEKKYHWTQISPALYATPEATPLPDSPSSFPPSPYIINHKRRGPRLLKSFSEDDVPSRKKGLDEKANGNVTDENIEAHNSGADNTTVNGVSAPENMEVEQVNDFHDEEVGSSEVGNGVVQVNRSQRFISSNSDGDSEAFFDPRGFVSFSSSTDGEDNGNTDRSVRPGTPSAEFYDAWEELSSDGASQTTFRDVESELGEMRLSLLMEIEKRKQAEESLSNMRAQWQHIREQLSLAGLVLPANPTDLADANDICRQVHILRFVADSIGRGIAKTEAEVEMESQIEAKKIEIARLCDRLHYYEAVNREMSQRNQEGVEIARQNRQRRKRRQKWVWGSVATLITLGTAALAWSYLPSKTGASSSINHSQDHEHDDTTK